MSVLELQISTARDTSTLVGQFETAGGTRQIGNRCASFVQSVVSGNELAMSSTVPPQIVIMIQENKVRATGTFTFATVIATNTILINGVTFTCVASGAGANQFNVGGTDTLTAAAAAAAINASVTALVSGYVTATSALGVVTVQAVFYGLSGNQCTISSPNGTITASGARLTAGATDATSQTLQF